MLAAGFSQVTWDLFFKGTAGQSGELGLVGALNTSKRAFDM